MKRRGNTSSALRNLQRGARSPVGQSVQWGYYDTLTLSNTVLQYSFFQAGIGTNNKTEAQTNLPTNGAIPQGHRLWVYDIHMQYRGNGLKDNTFQAIMQAFLWNAYIKVGIVGLDAILHLPVSEMVGQPIMIAFQSLANQFQPFFPGNFRGIYPLNIPIVLPALQNFGLTMYTNTAASATVQNGDEMRFTLNGKLERLG